MRFARGFNDSGQVAEGRKMDDGNNSHVFIARANGMGITELKTLPGATDSIATDIKSPERAIEYSTVRIGDYAFGTDLDAVGATYFGSLGELSSIASGISDFRGVVGQFTVNDDDGITFNGGKIIYLSPLAPAAVPGREFITPIDISTRGQIVRYGIPSDDQVETFLPSYTSAMPISPSSPPIPDPGTYLILMISLCLLRLSMRRRR